MKSLKTKIIAVILLCTIVAVGVCGTMSFIAVSEAVDQDSEEIMTSTAENERLNLDGTLNLISQSVDSFASVCMEELTDFEKFKTDAKYVEEYTKQIEPIAEQFALNTQGALTCYVRYNPEFTEPTSGIFFSRDDMESDFTTLEPTDFSQYDPSDLEHVGWYYIPVNNGEPTWMDPYLNANINVYMISYVIPLFIDGESVGIVGMDIDFSMIQDQIAGIQFFDSGSAFLTSSSDNILYHKELEVGTALAEDEQYKSIVQSLDDKDGVSKTHYYTYQKQKKCMVYEPLQNGMKLVLTAPQSEIEKTTNALVKRILMAECIAIVFALVVGIIISLGITKPLKQIANIVTDTAELNFLPNAMLPKICRLKDETGDIARAVEKMQSHMRDMITEIKVAGDGFEQSMTQLETATKSVMEMCNDNSATTQELAATMQETAASTEGIYQNVAQINEHAGEIQQLSVHGNEMSQDVHQRAVHMQEITKEATQRTQQMYETVLQQSKDALEQAKAATKIQEMTEAITEISSQTNLLALNASIEAARAGEAGRGFAVVATEIGNLANQTLETVNNIDGIVQEVLSSVKNMGDCLSHSTEFLEKTVLSDYAEFQEVSRKYTEDANIFRENMEKIEGSIGVLSKTTGSVTQAVGGINSAVNEAANGVSDISEKTADMVGKVSATSEDVYRNRENVERLEKIVGEFRL